MRTDCSTSMQQRTNVLLDREIFQQQLVESLISSLIRRLANYSFKRFTGLAPDGRKLDVGPSLISWHTQTGKISHTFMGQCHKNFFVRNLRIFVISQSVCPWQAFPAQSNVCVRGQEPTLDWSKGKVLHLGRLWPYPQTLDQAGKTCHGQTLQLMTKICKLRTKKVL